MGNFKEKIGIRGRTAFKALVVLLAVTSMSGRAWGTTYGGEGDNTTFYSADPLILDDGDSVVGFASFAGGFHTAADASVTFSNVSVPIAKDIYLHNHAHLNFEGDLTLSTTSIAAGGDFMINAGNNTLFLDKDTTLPAQQMCLTSSCTIDGLGHTVEFVSGTQFNLNNNYLTLKNMVIKGLTGNPFSGLRTLVLQNCVLDVNGSFDYAGGRLTIIDDVIVQGGGTLRFGSTGTMRIGAFSTLYIDQDTTFDYNCATNSNLVMSDATSTLHINGGTLKAMQGAGLQLLKGRLFFEGNCILQTRDSESEGVTLGNDGSVNDVSVKVLPGAQVQVTGYLYHKPIGSL